MNCIGLGDLGFTGHEVGQVGEVHVVGAFGIFPFFLFDGVSLILIINSAEPKQVASRVTSVEVKDVPVTNSELSFCWSLRIYIQRLVLARNSLPRGSVHLRSSGLLPSSSLLSESDLLRGSVLLRISGLLSGNDLLSGIYFLLRGDGLLSGLDLLSGSGPFRGSVLLLGLLRGSVLCHKGVEGWDFFLVIRGS